MFLVPVPGHETRHELTELSTRSRFTGDSGSSVIELKERCRKVLCNLTEQILGLTVTITKPMLLPVYANTRCFGGRVAGVVNIIYYFRAFFLTNVYSYITN